MESLIEGERDSLDVLFDCLADRERRWVLGTLRDRDPAPVTRDELVRTLAAWRRDDREPASDEGEAHQRARIDLRHVHLPKLAAAGLVSGGADGVPVSIAPHPAYQDDGVLAVIDGGGSADPTSLDALFRTLADGRRRTALDVLSHQYGPIHVETLAREIGARERNVAEAAVPEGIVEPILVDLHHAHLPRLAASALIEYDAERGTVEYRGQPDLRVPWMHSVLQPDFRASLTDDGAPREIGTIEGREGIISFGQSLCDRADEELFCMFTDVDLLEAGCLTRLRDAARRGADVYLGTPDRRIQEHVRTHAPQVILWEPDTNWLTLPVAGNRVGRLILADREAVMLGTLKEAATGEANAERAVIGEGVDNVLSVMVTQLLVPHLEQLDRGTADVSGALPF